MIPGMIKGYVQNKITGERIANGQVTTSTGVSICSSDGQFAPIGYYEFPHEGGPSVVFNMYCNLPGYRPWVKNKVTLAEGQTKFITIKMTPC